MPVTIAATPPPKKAPAASTKAADTGNSMSKKAKERADGLAGIGQLLTAGLLFARQHADAGAVHRFGPDIYREAAKLGDDNPKVGEFLDSLTAVGPYAGLIGAVLPLAFQVMVNHNRMEAGQVANLGVVSKETLQAQVQTQIMKAEAEALQEKIAMERERQEWLAEYERFEAEIQQQRVDAELRKLTGDQ